MKAGNAARLVSVCLACVKPWVQSLAPHKTKVVAQVCNPKPSMVKQVNQKFKDILGYTVFWRPA